MKSVAFWLVVLLGMLSTVSLLMSCGSTPPTAEQLLLGGIDWTHPEHFTWYGTPEGITWENPRYVKYRDRDNIEIVSKDGIVFGIYGRTLSQFRKQ